MPSGRLPSKTERADAAAAGEAYLKVWEELPRCVECARVMRPMRAKALNWPATVARALVNMCSGCYQHKQMLGKERLPPRPQFTSFERMQRSARPTLKTRVEISQDWDELQHAAAFTVCSWVDNPEHAREIIAMLGLFDENPIAYSGLDSVMIDPHRGGRSRNSREADEAEYE